MLFMIQYIYKIKGGKYMKEKLLLMLKEEGFEGFIVNSFEEAKNNTRRKNIVLLEDGIYITFKANFKNEDNIFGELVCWVKDEFDEDEKIYQIAINSIIDLFSYSDDELNNHIIEDDLIETFEKYE